MVIWGVYFAICYLVYQNSISHRSLNIVHDVEINRLFLFQHLSIGQVTNCRLIYLYGIGQNQVFVFDHCLVIRYQTCSCYADQYLLNIEIRFRCLIDENTEVMDDERQMDVFIPDKDKKEDYGSMVTAYQADDMA